MRQDPETMSQPIDGEECQRYFFVHIQKTAGISLRQHLIANLGRDSIYPPLTTGKNAKLDFLITYLSGALLISLPPEMQSQYRLFHGHMPFTVSRRLCFERPLKTFVMLRDPVERTLSVLGQKKRHRPEYANSTLEEIYEDPKVYDGQILNHQAKVFAIPDDGGKELLGGYSPYAVDEDGLERAKRNLETVDVIGLLHDMQGFLDNLGRTFGWTMLEENIRENVGSKREVSQSLLDRIVEENQIELEFYRHAVELVEQRAGA